ncbi:hypothetical protein EDC01DRAFT_779967 [Geopyxis carbonaria]|nr:hypothetical protein EDC01DRAFT_779967 [Geopyxis carbonaria]
MDIKDNDGNTALQLAMHRKNNSNLVQMMIRHRQNREPAAHVKQGVRGPEEVQGPAE